MYLSEEEYLLYLCKLRIYNEISLLRRTISTNFKVYPIDELDISSFLNIRLKPKSRKSFYGTTIKILKSTIKSDYSSDSQKTQSNLNSNLNIPAELRDFIHNNETISSTDKKLMEEFKLEDFIEKKVLKIDNEDINNELEKAKLYLDKVLVSKTPEESATIPEYIERIKPKIYYSFENRNSKYNFTIFEYKEFKTIERNNVFDEKFLYSKEKLCGSTVISCEDVHLGTINAGLFNEIIREVKERKENLSINLLCNSQLFKSINSQVFYKSYYKCFSEKIYRRGDLLIKENTPCVNLYFIVNGEFDCGINMNNIELLGLIRNLGGKIDVNIEVDEKEKMQADEDFYKFMHKKSFCQIIKYKYDLISVGDNLINNNYIYDVKCLSNKSSVLFIDLYVRYI